MKTVTISQVLKVNIPFTLRNYTWNKDIISKETAIEKAIENYSEKGNIDFDITKEQIRKFIVNAFNNPLPII